jgi:hypothetical protein
MIPTDITSFRGAVAPAGVGAPADRKVRRWKLSLTADDATSEARRGLQQEVVDAVRVGGRPRQSASSALRYAIWSTSEAKTIARTEATQRVVRGATSKAAVKSVANHMLRQ